MLSPDKELQQRFEMIMSEWIIDTMQLFTVLYHESLGNLFRVFGFQIKITSRKAISRNILSSEEELHSRMFSLLFKNKEKVSLNADAR